MTIRTLADHPITDYRLIHPLACHPEDGLNTWAVDTLHCVSITLHLLADLLVADLLGGHNGESELLATNNQRFALYLQINGLGNLLAAVKDALDPT